MKMKTPVLLGLGLLFILTGSVLAYQFKFGAFVNDTGKHEDKVSFGFQNRFTQVRRELSVPHAYGRFVSCTMRDGLTVLWFESLAGDIRNVVVDGTEPIIVKRAGELQ